MDDEEARTIGQRLRMIRRRRGMGLAVAAGLAGISKPYLSQLERGLRGFNRRGLLEDLAEALGCSVADLTGQPYLPPDRATAVALSETVGISAALHDATLDDVPDMPTRPVDELALEASKALANADDVQFGTAAPLGAVIAELHVHAVAGDVDTRRNALTALIEACIAARALAGTLGHAELAATAARRGYEAACRLEDRADLVGLTAMGRTMTLGRLGARRRAYAIASEALTELSAEPGPTRDNTRTAEASGMLHLSAALVSARDGRTEDAATHLTEARSLAAYTGERNHVRFHFRPHQCGRLGSDDRRGDRFRTGERRTFSSLRRSTCRYSAAGTGRSRCTLTSLVRGRRPKAHATRMRCVRWISPTA